MILGERNHARYLSEGYSERNVVMRASVERKNAKQKLTCALPVLGEEKDRNLSNQSQGQY